MSKLAFFLFSFPWLLPACGGDPGAVEILWSFPPTREGGCEGEPAIATVRAEVREGSIVQDQEIQCRLGQTILIPDVEEGSYILTVDALTADGTIAYRGSITGLQVDAGKTQSQSVTLAPLAGTLDLAWSLPVNCVADEVRDIHVQVWDGETPLYDNADDLIPCDDGVAEITGNWILTEEYPNNRLYVYGLDIGGVATHDFADCELVLQSGTANEVTASLDVCPGVDPECCPGGLCRELCPAM